MGYVGGLVADAQGNLYIAEWGNHAIWKLDSTSTLTRVAGNGINGVAGDAGPALTAAFSWPTSMAMDQAGNLYVTDWADHIIRKISTSGTITVIAGTFNAAFSGDGGPAINADLNMPTGIGLDPAGNIYFVDAGNQRIRRISTDGTISTIAGTGAAGYSGDGGTAASAKLSFGSRHFNGLLVTEIGKPLVRPVRLE